MKSPKINFFFLLFTLLSFATLQAQDKKEAAVKAMMETKNFVFIAQTANPQSGRLINLTSEYDVTVRPDSVIAYLPYYGRAYTAPINPADGGIKFTSSDFTYQSVVKKKNRWEISIKPHDANSVEQLNLIVFENGNASLSVNDQNRQSISFQGYVKEGRPLHKKGF